jgi:hypothetical protein
MLTYINLNVPVGIWDFQYLKDIDQFLIKPQIESNAATIGKEVDENCRR